MSTTTSSLPPSLASSLSRSSLSYHPSARCRQFYKVFLNRVSASFPDELPQQLTELLPAHIIEREGGKEALQTIIQDVIEKAKKNSEEEMLDILMERRIPDLFEGLDRCAAQQPHFADGTSIPDFLVSPASPLHHEMEYKNTLIKQQNADLRHQLQQLESSHASLKTQVAHHRELRDKKEQQLKELLQQQATATI